VPSSIPSVSGAKVIKALESVGFTVARVNGSHHIMRHPDGCSVAVPLHAGRDIAKGTLRGILASIGITPDEFRALL
jgi:predicted RNA binding protein YcfA (HicA-like mRNA interferase family)